MIASSNAENLAKESENLSLEPYNCPSGHATIGFGHLMHLGPVTKEEKAIRWTLEKANSQFSTDMAVAAKAVERAVRVPLNQNQFDALVDWTFNLGETRLTEKECSWLRELNRGNYPAVPELLKRWNKGEVKGVLVVMPGLVTRRQKEADLFSKPYPEAIS
jgi:lysozyme